MGHLYLSIYLSYGSSDYTVQTRAKAQSAEFGQLLLFKLMLNILLLLVVVVLVVLVVVVVVIVMVTLTD